MKNVGIISVLLAGFFTAGRVTALCNDTVLDACVAPFVPYLIGFAAGNIDTSNITVACRQLNQTTSCVTNNATCADTEAPTLTKWVGPKKTIEYVCYNETGRNGYLNNLRCLSNSSYQAGLDACMTNYNTDTKARADVACKTLNSLLSCINTSSQGICGESTTLEINKIMLMRFSPAVSVQAPGCTGLCSSAALETCLAPFKAVYWGAFSAASVSSSNIDMACSTFSDSASCVATRTKCADTDPISMMEWTGKKAIITNNCGAGKADYLKIQPCISGKPFLNQSAACYAPLAACNDPMIACAAPTADFACAMYKTQMRCVVKAAQTVCGTDAAAFFTKNILSTTAPTVRLFYPTCNLSDWMGPMGTSGAVSLSTKVSLSLLLAGLASLLHA